MRCRHAILMAACATAPSGAAAHQLLVFASVDCEAVTVEAKFSNGNAVQVGDVMVNNGQDELIETLPLAEDGTVQIPLDTVDHSTGLVIRVDLGSHDNYWIVTPEDIARSCQS